MRKVLFVLALLAVVSWGATANAAVIIDFSTGSAGSGGTITYAGGANPLVGTDIRIGALSSAGTPLNDGAYLAVKGFAAGTKVFGELAFNTGNFTGMNGSIYEFGTGGWLTITGSVPDAGILSPVVLLSAPVVSGSYEAGSVKLAIVGGTDTKNQDLLDYFGLFAVPGWSFSGTVHTSSTTFPIAGGFTAPVANSTDISNTAVPEPGSMLLLGTGLFGLAGAVRRRFKK